MAGKAETKMMPALGRPFRLGMLYDIRKDELVPGITLWDKATMQKALSVEAQPHEEGSTGSIIAEDSIEKKANALDIKASLKLSFMGGLIEVSGSAAYLDDRKSSSRKARVTLKFSTTTRFEQLSMELLGAGNVEYQDAFGNGIATHVVTGIMYGGQAFFVFDREVSETENFKNVQGNLHVRVKSLPGIQIEGDASVKMDEHEKREVEKFNCTFYGDFIPDRNPTTYEDAVLLYQNLPRMMLGEDRRKARPVKVWLYPLENLDSRAAKLVREISVNLVNQVELVFEELQNYQMRCNDLIKEDVCTYFPRIKDQLFQFQKMVSEFKINFQQCLLPVLPKIRGCGADETHLAQILLDKEGSPFSCRKLTVWLDEKEREVKVLRSYVDMLTNIQFAYGPGDLDSVIGDPANQIVICYTFKLSVKCDLLLLKLAKYLGKPVEEDDDVMLVLPWYECKDVTQRMVKSARLFNQFALVNKHTNNIKTIITDEILSADNQAKLGANIILYKDGVVIDEDFEPPSAPLYPTVESVEHDSISLDCLPPEFGSQNVQQYEFTYRIIGDNSDDWQSSISKVTSVKLSKLRIAVAYEVKVRAVSMAGYSAFVDIPGAIVTLPTSPPSKPRATDVSATSLILVWLKPMSIGEHVEIDRYNVFWKKIGDGNWTTVKTKSAVESLNIGGLKPKTTYKFHVVAVCGEAGCSAPSDDSNEVTTTQVKVQDNMQNPSSYPSPKVVVIGVTGSGKSTLCNALAGKDPSGNDDGGFPVSEKPSACTWQTTMRTANWLGTEQQLTIIDTPGLDDPSGKDTEHIAEMIEKLKKIQFVNAFLIVFNGQNPRLDRSLKSMLQLFSGMFGSCFLGNTILQFSRWSFDRRAQAMRKKQGLSEASQHKEWNQKFREELGASVELPTVYIDAHYLEDDPTEVVAFQEQTQKLWKVISTLKPYECKDFEAVMAEHDQLIAKAADADEKRKAAEAAKKLAEDAANKAKLAQQQADKDKAAAEKKQIEAANKQKKADEEKAEAIRKKKIADEEATKAKNKAEEERLKREAAERQRREAEERAAYQKRRNDWEALFAKYSDNRQLADKLYDNFPERNGSVYVGVYNPCVGYCHHTVNAHLSDTINWRFRHHGHNIAYGHVTSTSPPSHWVNAFNKAVDSAAAGEAEHVFKQIKSSLTSAGVRWAILHVVGWGNGLRARVNGCALFRNREGTCSCVVVLDP